MKKSAKVIRIYGIVQGVGFRPFVKNLADRLGIEGKVLNKGSFVEILASGYCENIRKFYDAINAESPDRAYIIGSEEEDIDEAEFLRECPENGVFFIEESLNSNGEKYIPPDIGICERCAKELYDPENRRYLHPFINCTQCGPRFIILKKLPYDRERTSMAGFPMCDACASEYYDPASRRFDAQPVCCPDCGPSFYILEKGSDGQGFMDRTEESGRQGFRAEKEPGDRGIKAIREVRNVIREGGIAAVKGIGGFHLCCDAGNEAAIRKLRERKNRPSKPFAVMMKDLSVLRRECGRDIDRERLLSGYQKPIVLFKRSPASSLPDIIAPDNPYLGVLLPYTPVHLLLFDIGDGGAFPDSLIMTSGNISGAPICITDKEAKKELSGIADIILSNDREILTRADDSVVDFYDGKPYILRRSRGFAPLPIKLPGERRDNKECILGVGGELKNCFSIARGDLIYPSAYVGDMTDYRSLKALDSGIKRLKELLDVKPDRVVCDLHPAYNTVSLAVSLAERYEGMVIKLQHHYAHILSVMAENGHTGTVIGGAFDGTGYGTDGTIWGGEIIRADTNGFERLSHIHPFLQAGGDRASREGWRIALSIIKDCFGDEGYSISEKLKLCERSEAETVYAALEQGIGVTESTSAGRLFDAVSAILGIKRSSSFEGEAAMALQFSAERYCGSNGFAEADREAFEVFESFAEHTLSSTDRLFKEIVLKRLSGEDRDRLSYVFHKCLALMLSSDILDKCDASGIGTAALSGGCFQNLLFLRLSVEALEGSGLKVLTNSLVPANDGGIALGQCLYGMLLD